MNIVAFIPLAIILGIFILIIWIIIPSLIAKAAREKGRSYAGFFILSILFSPLIGGLILLLLGKNENEINRKKIESGENKYCPYCANIIQSKAMICTFCQRELIKKEKIDELIQKNEYVHNNFNNPYVIITDTILKMQPDVNAREITDLRCDDIVDFLSEAYEDININNFWYKVKYKSFEGWCLRTSLKKYR